MINLKNIYHESSSFNYIWASSEITFDLGLSSYDGNYYFFCIFFDLISQNIMIPIITTPKTSTNGQIPID